MRFYTNCARRGNNILFRGYDKSGRVEEKIRFSPTLYFPSQQETGWKGIHGEDVMPRVFDTMKDASDASKQYEDVENFKLHGNTNYVAQYIQENFPGEIDHEMGRINIGTLDIEVHSDDGFPDPQIADWPITLICVKSNQGGTYHVWGCGEFDPMKSIVVDPTNPTQRIQYRRCSSEQDLILQFLTWWENNCPDILTGWNVEKFDVTYIVNRIRKILGDQSVKRLSPWGYVDSRTIKEYNKEIVVYSLVGVSVLDYQQVFSKFDYAYGTPESMKLDHIAHIVLGERKLSYEEHGNLFNLYHADHQLYTDYCVKDVMLVERLEDQLKLLELVITIAYMAGVNYTECLGTVGIWDTIIYRFLHSMNVVVPPKESKHKAEYPGGYVKDPMIGLQKWVTSFDLNSLYPNLIVQYNISPETLVDEVHYPNGVKHFMDNPAQNPHYSVAANGSMYRKDKQGVMPKIVVDYYAQRKAVKGQMLAKESEREIMKKDGKDVSAISREIIQLNNKQMAVKILLNSMYGALGNAYFRYFDLRMAEGITLSGQLSILWAERTINETMNKIMGTKDKDYVIAIDTDSLYIKMLDLVEKFKPEDPVKFLDEASKKSFTPTLNKAYGELVKHMGAYDSRMVMDREVIADVGVWTAKKRYILNVHNSEGVQYATPKLKMMGIEAVKSSTPQVVRDKFKECFRIIMENDEAKLQQEVKKFRREFGQMEPHLIAFPRGISELDKWTDPVNITKKGCPIHVRAGIYHNTLLKKKGVEKIYDEIRAGSKIKFVYLKTPNPIQSNVIGFEMYMPKEFGLHDYVDYQTQFEKTFRDPLKLITDAMGWQLEKVNTLEQFFG